ncbi:MAG: methionyl-tRNA formyltransferase [Hyphomicrobiaceae bacterium]
MRLIVMGQQAFGKDALAKILENEQDEIVAVYCEPDREGRPVDPIKEFALEKGLPVHQPADFKSQESLDTLAAHNADLMVMAFVNVFVPEAARDTPAHGSICFHPSLLPLHRGPSAVNWPIIFGSTKSGFSWFYPTDGLDEGDVLMQWECPIGPDDTVIDLYFKKIYPAAIASVPDVIDAFRDGNPPRTSQDESKATYEYRCKKKDAEIDWSKPVGDVYNLIRGTNPSPGAWTRHGETELQIFDSAKLGPGDGFPGPAEVASVTGEGVTVAASGGVILVKRVRPKGGDKQLAHEYAAASGLKAGDRLG